jgi:hypothetical protein
MAVVRQRGDHAGATIENHRSSWRDSTSHAPSKYDFCFWHGCSGRLRSNGRSKASGDQTCSTSVPRLAAYGCASSVQDAGLRRGILTHIRRRQHAPIAPQQLFGDFSERVYFDRPAIRRPSIRAARPAVSLP